MLVFITKIQETANPTTPASLNTANVGAMGQDSVTSGHIGSAGLDLSPHHPDSSDINVVIVSAEIAQIHCMNQTIFKLLKLIQLTRMLMLQLTLNTAIRI